MGSLFTSPNSYSEDSSCSGDEEVIGDDLIMNQNEIPNFCKPSPVVDLSGNCLDSATDAFDATTSTKCISLNLDQVLWVENNLDLYEKISLVYLLFDDAHYALQELTLLLNDNMKKVLNNWAINQNNVWQEKLIEAVCIIQNYKVLRALGFQRKDLDERFLPHHAFTGLSVNKVKKALYFVCEAQTAADMDNLLKVASSDFERKKIKFKWFNEPYLELYFLYWETTGYIKQDNINNLCTVLKQMEQFDMCDTLRKVVPQTEQIQSSLNNNRNKQATGKTTDASASKNHNKKSVKVFDNILNNESSLMEVMSLESQVSIENPSDTDAGNKYHIDPADPGVCLIINQENFYADVDKKVKHLLPPLGNKLESRLGTEKDKRSLEDTFKQFGFKTEVVNNLTHTEMINTISEFLQQITIESSLFICIMSHGDEGAVYGVNSCRVRVKTIQKLLCTKNRENLTGKPKILILQSCQGTQCQKITTVEELDDNETDGPSSPRELVPPMADLFTFWATVPGYGAIRNKRTGSWFIQSLCEKMKNLGANQHFEDICTDVIRDVSSKTWMQEWGEVAMVPMKDSTLRKLFYLPSTQF